MHVNMKALIKLAKMLEKKPHTFNKISQVMKCSKETARKRVSMLEDRGCKFKVTNVREKVRGPMPFAFHLVPNRASKKLLSVAN